MKEKENVKKSNEINKLIIAVKRNNGYVYRKELNIYNVGINNEENIFIVERIIKTILWTVGGYEIYIAGSDIIYNAINEFYKPNKKRSFDYNFMANVYENEFKGIKCD